MESKFSLSDLENLKRAYGSGILRVRMQDTETEYRSLEELGKAIERVEKELAIRPKGPFLLSLEEKRWESC